MQHDPSREATTAAALEPGDEAEERVIGAEAIHKTLHQHYPLSPADGVRGAQVPHPEV